MRFKQTPKRIRILVRFKVTKTYLRRHTCLQKTRFICIFSAISWMRIRIPNTDPDLGQPNEFQDPQHCFTGHLKAWLLAISVEEPLLGHARLCVLQHTGGLRLLRNIWKEKLLKYAKKIIAAIFFYGILQHWSTVSVVDPDAGFLPNPDMDTDSKILLIIFWKVESSKMFGSGSRIRTRVQTWGSECLILKKSIKNPL